MTSVSWLWNSGDSDIYPYVIRNSLCSVVYLVHTFPSALKQQLGFFFSFVVENSWVFFLLVKTNKQNLRLDLLPCSFFQIMYIFVRGSQFPYHILLLLLSYYWNKIASLWLVWRVSSFTLSEVVCSRFVVETLGFLESLAWCSPSNPLWV